MYRNKSENFQILAVLATALYHDLVRKNLFRSLQVLINSSVCLLSDMFVFIQELFDTDTA